MTITLADAKTAYNGFITYFFTNETDHAYDPSQPFWQQKFNMLLTDDGGDVSVTHVPDFDDNEDMLITFESSNFDSHNGNVFRATYNELVSNSPQAIERYKQWLSANIANYLFHPYEYQISVAYDRSWLVPKSYTQEKDGQYAAKRRYGVRKTLGWLY